MPLKPPSGAVPIVHWSPAVLLAKLNRIRVTVSVMTNVPGESGDPSSKYYSDLIEDWATGNYHPMAFSRKYVEASTAERFVLTRK